MRTANSWWIVCQSVLEVYGWGSSLSWRSKVDPQWISATQLFSPSPHRLTSRPLPSVAALTLLQLATTNALQCRYRRLLRGQAPLRSLFGSHATLAAATLTRSGSNHRQLRSRRVIDLLEDLAALVKEWLDLQLARQPRSATPSYSGVASCQQRHLAKPAHARAFTKLNFLPCVLRIQWLWCDELEDSDCHSLYSAWVFRHGLKRSSVGNAPAFKSALRLAITIW